MVTVEPGDSLSKIARTSWDRQPVAGPVRRQQDAAQPQGLPDITDPDVIYAGQQVTVPHAPPAQHDPDSATNTATSEQPPSAKSPSAHPRDGDHQPSHHPERAGSPPPSAAPAPDAPTSHAPGNHPSRPRGSELATEAPTPPPTARSSPPARTPSVSVDAPPSAAAAPPTPAVPSARHVAPLPTVLGAGAVLERPSPARSHCVGCCSAAAESRASRSPSTRNLTGEANWPLPPNRRAQPAGLALRTLAHSRTEAKFGAAAVGAGGTHRGAPWTSSRRTPLAGSDAIRCGAVGWCASRRRSAPGRGPRRQVAPHPAWSR
ncbi:hypothetical protein E4K10_45280 [Streptomyces sp. T1317-0309]|nr:hypothetical protein E4K10_45280 [Streptomyces sp. T1317-0309]